MAKKNKPGSHTPQLGPDAYIKKFGRSLTLEACYITEDWTMHGMTNILVVRSKKSGQKVVGFYLVDVYCLGLKNTFHRIDLPAYEIDEIVSGGNGGGIHQEIDPNLAFNIIYGGIEYAEDLGLSPHKDFNVTEYLLPKVEDIPYIDVEFGRNGKPYLILNPHDNAGKIISTLNKTVGPDGYEIVRLAGEY